MKVLGIEASTRMLSLGAVEGSDTLFKYHRLVERGASSIPSYLSRLLVQHSLRVNDFDSFVIGAGPGSFTGLRISFAIIKSFAIALGKPVIPLGSFFSIAEKVKTFSSKIAVLADARRNLVYAARFTVKNGILKKESKEKLATLEEFFCRYKGYMCVTYDAHIRDAAQTLDKRVRFYPEDVWPDALTLVHLANNADTKSYRTTPDMEPLYIYPKDCQVRHV